MNINSSPSLRGLTHLGSCPRSSGPWISDMTTLRLSLGQSCKVGVRSNQTAQRVGPPVGCLTHSRPLICREDLIPAQSKEIVFLDTSSEASLSRKEGIAVELFECRNSLDMFSSYDPSRGPSTSLGHGGTSLWSQVKPCSQAAVGVSPDST